MYSHETLPCLDLPCPALPCPALPCPALLWSAVLCYAVLCHTQSSLTQQHQVSPSRTGSISTPAGVNPRGHLICCDYMQALSEPRCCLTGCLGAPASLDQPCQLCHRLEPLACIVQLKRGLPRFAVSFAALQPDSVCHTEVTHITVVHTAEQHLQSKQPYICSR